MNKIKKNKKYEIHLCGGGILFVFLNEKRLMWEQFFSHVNVPRENVHFLDGNAADLQVLKSLHTSLSIIYICIFPTNLLVHSYNPKPTRKQNKG
jgi:hypothetical protein